MGLGKLSVFVGLNKPNLAVFSHNLVLQWLGPNPITISLTGCWYQVSMGCFRLWRLRMLGKFPALPRRWTSRSQRCYGSHREPTNGNDLSHASPHRKRWSLYDTSDGCEGYCRPFQESDAARVVSSTRKATYGYVSKCGTYTSADLF